MLLTHKDSRMCGLALVGLLNALATSAVLAQTAQADDAQAGGDKVCQCRAPGGLMRDLGTVECVNIAGKSVLLYCTMSTNTPYWKEIENVEGCPAA